MLKPKLCRLSELIMYSTMQLLEWYFALRYANCKVRVFVLTFLVTQFGVRQVQRNNYMLLLW